MNNAKSHNIQLEVLPSSKSVKGLYFMSLSVTTLQYFAIFLGTPHKASTLYRYILLRIQSAYSILFGFFFLVLSDVGLKDSISDISMWKESFPFLFFNKMA